MKKKQNKLSNRTMFFLAILVLAVSIFAGLKIFTNGGGYAVIEEDRANTCINGVETLVGQQLVEVKIPREELQSYVQEAKASGKCYRIISY